MALRLETKIRKLQQALDGARALLDKEHGNADSLAWRRATAADMLDIFGEGLRYTQFAGLSFTASYATVGATASNKQFCYDRDLNLAIKAFEGYLVDFKEEAEHQTQSAPPVAPAVTSQQRPQKVFISHASLDVAVVTELILLLRSLGLQNEQIFCTSVPGYKIRLGTKNFLDAIKEEIRSGAVVIFLLSKNFYNSPVCLAEMGAAWVLDSDMIPLVLPPFEFRDVRGVIPFTQGMMVNDALGVHDLAETLEELFGFSAKRGAVWEGDRDRILAAINTHIAAAAEPEQVEATANTPAKAKSKPATPAAL
jgi:hypothetical protein